MSIFLTMNKQICAKAKWALPLALLLSVVTAQANAATPACPLRIGQKITSQQAVALQKKGYMLIYDYRSNINDYRKQFQKGEFGFWPRTTNRGVRGYILWRTDLMKADHVAFEYDIKSYLKKYDLLASSYKNFEQQMPLCKELATIKPNLHFAQLMRLNGEKSKQALLNGMKTKFSWGEFFIDVEATRLGYLDFNKRQAWINQATARYKKILALKSRLDSIADGREKIDYLREELFRNFGLKNYCRSKYLILNFLSDKNPCGNCVAQTLLIISLIKDFNINMSSQYELGVQQFSDHIQPVLLDHKNNKIINLVVNSENTRFDGTIYKPELLFWNYENSLKIKNSVHSHWYFSSLEARRSLIANQKLSYNFTETIFGGWLLSSERPGRLYTSGPALSRYLDKEPPEKATLTITRKNMNSMSLTGSTPKKSSRAEKFSSVTEALTSKGWVFKSRAGGGTVSSINIEKYFDEDEIKRFKSAQTLQDLKRGLKLTNFQQNQTFAYGIFFECHTPSSAEEKALIAFKKQQGLPTLDIFSKDFELTTKTEGSLIIRFIRLFEQDASKECQAKLNSFERYSVAVTEAQNAFEKLYKYDGGYSLFLRYLRTGNPRFLTGLTQVDTGEVTGGPGQLDLLSTQISSLAPGISYHSQYPIDKVWSESFIFRIRPVTKGYLKDVIASLKVFQNENADHYKFFAQAAALNDKRQNTFFVALSSLNYQLSSFASENAHELNQAVKSELLHLGLETKDLTRQRFVTLFTPARQVLTKLIEDKKNLIIPTTTEAQIIDLKKKLVQLKNKKDKLKEVLQAKALETPGRVPARPDIIYLKLHNSPEAVEETELELWEKEVTQFDARVFQGLILSQTYADIKSADFAFAIHYRWSNEFIKDPIVNDEYLFGTRHLVSFWYMGVRNLFAPILLPQDYLRFRNPNKLNEYRDLWSSITSFKTFEDSFQLYHANSGLYLKISEPQKVDEVSWPFAFQKLPNEVFAWLYKFCTSKKSSTECTKQTQRPSTVKVMRQYWNMDLMVGGNMVQESLKDSDRNSLAMFLNGSFFGEDLMFQISDKDNQILFIRAEAH